jgi:hypothetical protein
MKNSREHAQQLRKLHRALKRAHPKVEPVTYADVIDALIYGIVSERMSESAAHAALRGMKEAFIDWNDLRVSRVEEVIDVFGKDTPAGRSTASSLTMVLRAVLIRIIRSAFKPCRRWASVRPGRRLRSSRA